MKNYLILKLALLVVGLYFVGLYTTVEKMFLSSTDQEIARITHDDKDANPPKKQKIK